MVPAAKRRRSRRRLNLLVYSVAVFVVALAAFDMMGGVG